MSSRVWPPPTDAEKAAMEVLNPLQEACDSCGSYPCECDDEDDEDNCETCGYSDCECFEVYVVYSTTVTVTVDIDGDVTGVRVNSSLDDLLDVVDEDEASLTADVTTLHGKMRARAAEAVQNQDWPSWDID